MRESRTYTRHKLVTVKEGCYAGQRSRRSRLSVKGFRMSRVFMVAHVPEHARGEPHLRCAIQLVDRYAQMIDCVDLGDATAQVKLNGIDVPRAVIVAYRLINRSSAPRNHSKSTGPELT